MGNKETKIYNSLGIQPITSSDFKHWVGRKTIYLKMYTVYFKRESLYFCQFQF